MTNPTTPQDEYHAPITAPSSGGGIEWLPRLPFANEGNKYVNEADPSWEEVVAMVVIPGNPDAVKNAAGAWEVVFEEIGQAKGLIDRVAQGLQSWQGAAADAYRDHLNTLGQGMTDLVEKHRPVVQQLNSSADNVQKALENTPIPDDMVDQVIQARQNYATHGTLPTQFQTGFFYNTLFPIFHDRWLAELGSILTFGFTDWVSNKLRDWLSDGDDKAKAAYHQLAGQHVTTMDSMPSGSQLLTDDANAATVTPGMPGSSTVPGGVPGVGSGTTLAGAGGGGPIGSMSGMGTGAGGLGGLSGLGNLGGPGGLSGAGGGGLPAGFGSGASMPGSGSAASKLAGGGGMGMMGAGGMAAGARGAGAGGARMGGVGAGGAGAGGARMGGMPMGGMAGAGGGARGAGGRAGGAGMGAAGAGAGAAGRGAAGGRAGMGGMMGGHGGAGGEGATDHSTWLEEDEDVWGSDSDAAPPVLGG
jgi:uncharacterized protein YukE